MEYATDTVAVKDDGGYKVINKADFDEAKHELFNGGQVPSGTGVDSTRNPSGTYSEPTPTDIRYPNKDETEFENNHGAFVGKSAAEIREERGLPDAPGGINPQVEVEGDGEGLTKAEIIADLEALQVDFDPSAKKADLLALRNDARAKRDGGQA